MKRNALTIAPGARVHLHQAFKCCPYAGTVTSQIHDFLERNSYQVVPSPDDADVHVINTCGSDSRQAQQTFDALDVVAGASPGTPVVVTGCLCSIEPARLESTLGATPHTLLDPRHLAGLDDIFDTATIHFEDVPPEPREQYVGEGMNAGYFRVIAGIGCFGRCSFCAIRRATGRPRSESIERILADVRRGMDAGWRDILLVHTDLSAWGSDIGATPVELLNALVRGTEGTLFSVVSFEPTLFLEWLPGLLPVFATGRFAYLSIPIQSGAQRILDAMRRTYRIEDVLEAVERVHEVAPDVVLQTDIIYGYGDETDAELEASIAAARSFDIVSFVPYQPRPSTPPRTLPDEIMAARRERAMRELRERAKTPGREVPRVLPIPEQTEPSAEATDGRKRLPVLDQSASQAWHEQLTRRLARIIARRGSFDLGGGWRTEDVRSDAQRGSAVLVSRGPRGASFELMLLPPEHEGALLARSDRFAAAVLGELIDPPPDVALALRNLLLLLGLSPTNGQAAEGRRS